MQITVHHKGTEQNQKYVQQITTLNPLGPIYRLAIYFTRWMTVHACGQWVRHTETDKPIKKSNQPKSNRYQFLSVLLNRTDFRSITNPFRL